MATADTVLVFDAGAGTASLSILSFFPFFSFQTCIWEVVETDKYRYKEDASYRKIDM
jgi:molecular chaperone DnaK (HSP70)